MLAHPASLALWSLLRHTDMLHLLLQKYLLSHHTGGPLRPRGCGGPAAGAGQRLRLPHQLCGALPAVRLHQRSSGAEERNGGREGQGQCARSGRRHACSPGGTLHCLHPSRSGSRDSSPRLRVPELSPCAPSLQAMRDFASDLGSTLGLDVYAYSGAENSAASLPGPPSSASRPAAA